MRVCDYLRLPSPLRSVLAGLWKGRIGALTYVSLFEGMLASQRCVVRSNLKYCFAMSSSLRLLAFMGVGFRNEVLAAVAGAARRARIWEAEPRLLMHMFDCATSTRSFSRHSFAQDTAHHADCIHLRHCTRKIAVAHLLTPRIALQRCPRIATSRLASR